jgi:hypothetical protein
MYSTDFKTWNKARIKCRSCGDPWYGDLAFENGIFFVVGSATSFSTTKIALASVNGKDFVEQSACGPADDYDNVFPDGNGNFYAMQGSTYSIFHPAQ